MSIKIIHYHEGRVNGTLTSVIDLYLNMSKYAQIELKISTKDVAQFILLCKNNRYFGCDNILTFITNEKSFEAETVICSTKTLNDPIDIQCNKMILIDSLDIMRAHYGVVPILQSVCDDTILLCNPANAEVTDFNYIEYYHKFSPERLSRISTCEQFLYMRIAKHDIMVVEGLYFENIGKKIFETLYLNKRVDYYSRDVRDGLYYYLKLFGVDGAKDQIPLNISPDQIESKLFMHKNDKILELI